MYKTIHKTPANLGRCAGVECRNNAEEVSVSLNLLLLPVLILPIGLHLDVSINQDHLDREKYRVAIFDPWSLLLWWNTAFQMCDVEFDVTEEYGA